MIDFWFVPAFWLTLGLIACYVNWRLMDENEEPMDLGVCAAIILLAPLSGTIMFLEVLSRIRIPPPRKRPRKPRYVADAEREVDEWLDPVRRG